MNWQGGVLGRAQRCNIVERNNVDFIASGDLIPSTGSCRMFLWRDLVNGEKLYSYLLRWTCRKQRGSSNESCFIFCPILTIH